MAFDTSAFVTPEETPKVGFDTSAYVEENIAVAPMQNANAPAVNNSPWEPRENILQRKHEEAIKDSIEKQSRLGFFSGAFKTGISAGKEAVDLTKNIYKGIQLVNDFRKEPEKYAEKVKAQYKKDPNSLDPMVLMTAALKDSAATFGWTNEREFDIDTALNKWQNHPLSSLADLMLVGGVLNKAEKLGTTVSDAKKIKKAIDTSGKDLKDMVDIPNVAYKTEKQMLIEKAPVIQKMGLDDLRSKDWYAETSRRMGKVFDNYATKESQKLKQIVNKNRDLTLDVNNMSSKIEAGLKEGYLMDAEGGVKKNFNHPDVEAALDRLGLGEQSKLDALMVGPRVPEKLTAGEAKVILDDLDDAIRWDAASSSDVVKRGLKIVRDVYREEMKKVPGYDELAGRIHDRIVAFGDNNKAIKKLGGAEKVFGENVFSTKEQTEAFKNFFKSNPSREGNIILHELDRLDAWKKWNEALNTEIQHFPAYVHSGTPFPIPTKQFTRPVRERYAKAKLSAPARKAAEAIQNRPGKDTSLLKKTTYGVKTGEIFNPQGGENQ